MEDLSREIRFKCFLHSEGNNVARKRYNFFKTIKSIKEIAYRDSIRASIKKKHNFRELFGYNLSNFKSKYVNNEED
jgi:hypothetical protein